MPKNNFGAAVAAETTHASTALPSSRRLLWLLGPALVAGRRLPDPGNVAANMSAGAQYGYLLVWVVVSGNRDGMAWSNTSRPSWAWSRACPFPRQLPRALRDPAPAGSPTGCRPRRSPWPPTSQRSSAGPWPCTCSSTCRCCLGGLITGVILHGPSPGADPQGPLGLPTASLIALLLIIAVGFLRRGRPIAPPEASSLLPADSLPLLRRRQLGAALAASILGCTDHAPCHLRALLAPRPRPLRPGP